MLQDNNLENGNLRVMAETPSVAVLCSFNPVNKNHLIPTCSNGIVSYMPLHNKFRTTPEELRSMYVDRKMSPLEIADELKRNEKTIRQYLIKYGITRNQQGGQERLAEVLTEDVLRKVYIEEGKTLRDVAKILGCSQTTVFRKLEEFGLNVRRNEEADRHRRKVRREARGQLRQSSGYQYVTRADHHLANSNGYVAEHRVKAEEYMGIKLKPEDRVHHINFDKLNNERWNLAVLPSQAVHREIHEYLQKIGIYLLGFTEERPAPFRFNQAVFWAGEWVTSIDLLAKAEQGTTGAAGERAVVTVN